MDNVGGGSHRSRTARRRSLRARRGDALGGAGRARSGDVAEEHPGVAGAERSGFDATLSSLALPGEFELRIASGEIERGRISGRRKPLLRGDGQPIHPVMLTGFSRTGSNLLLRVLGAHQEIVAYRPYQYEPRVRTYWADVLRELTEPAANLRQIVTPGSIAERGWWLGLAPRMPRPLDDADVEGALAVDAVEDAVDFCQGRITRVYEQIAAATARPEAQLFAEKLLPGAVPTIAWELYPDAREVFLVRDFRDMMASVLDWKARFGGAWFGQGAARATSSSCAAATISRGTGRELAPPLGPRTPAPLRGPARTTPAADDRRRSSAISASRPRPTRRAPMAPARDRALTSTRSSTGRPNAPTASIRPLAPRSHAGAQRRPPRTRSAPRSAQFGYEPEDATEAASTPAPRVRWARRTRAAVSSSTTLTMIAASTAHQKVSISKSGTIQSVRYSIRMLMQEVEEARA